MPSLSFKVMKIQVSLDSFVGVEGEGLVHTKFAHLSLHYKVGQYFEP